MNIFLQLVEAGAATGIMFCSALVLRGFLPIALHWKMRDAVWHLAAGILLVVGALALRHFYWMYMPIDYRGYIGREIPNITFGFMAFYGGYLLLRLQWMIIPDIDRDKYNIWTSPWYPHEGEWRINVILRIFRNRKRG